MSVSKYPYSGAHPMQPNSRDRVVWTIAGFDPSSGAGVTADLQVFGAHGLWGCAAITALTVQTTVGVSAVEHVPEATLKATLEALAADLPAQGIKIGMLGTAETAVVVAGQLARLEKQGSEAVIVLDPVLRSSSGRELFPAHAIPLLLAELLPLVDWITPNRSELALLSGVEISDRESIRNAVHKLRERCPHIGIVVTGGEESTPVDILFTKQGSEHIFSGEHVQTRSTHGTGCAFSSAMVSQLVLGLKPVAAVQQAKRYVEGGLRRAPGVGGGRGPLELLWPLRESCSESLLP